MSMGNWRVTHLKTNMYLIPYTRVTWVPKTAKCKSWGQESATGKQRGVFFNLHMRNGFQLQLRLIAVSRVRRRRTLWENMFTISPADNPLIGRPGMIVHSYHPVFPRKWRQDKKFKVILQCIPSSRPTLGDEVIRIPAKQWERTWTDNSLKLKM